MYISYKKAMEEHVCHCSVKIEQLSVRKGNTEILKNVDLTANHGEILALIGRNGAGKTTLLKAILGQMPYSGQITYFNCRGKKIAKPRIGYVPQFLSFDRSTPVTVEDLFCANQSRVPVWLSHSKKRQMKAESLLEKVGGQGLFQKKLGSLSGGELQRVLLAFALDPMPDLLLLDEPVSAVDRKGVSVFYDLVTSLRSEYHMPVILVSHDIGHVKKYASKAAFLEDGTVAMQNTVDKVLNNPKVREAFGLD